MSRRFAQLVRNLFARQATRSVRRANLRCDTLEDRTVPTTVSVSKVSDTTEGGAAGVFRFSLDSALSSDLDVGYNVMSGSADGSDYSGLGGTVTIPAGKTSADVAVTAARDNLVEGSETVTVELYDDFMPYTKDPMAWSASLDIADDPPVVSVARSVATVAEGGTVTFTFTRSGGDTSQALDVSYMLSGDASSDDYTGLGTTVPIPAGKTSATVTMTAEADNEVEGDEEVWVDVTAGSAYDVTGGGAIVTIADDPPVVSVARSAATVGEGGQVTFTFSRTGGDTSQALTVYFTTGGNATDTVDYTGELSSTTIQIGAGKDSYELTMTAKRDNVVEDDEDVSVTLTDAMGFEIGTGLATTTIEDDPPLVWVEQIADASEDGDEGVFLFHRTGGDLSQSLTVSYTVQSVGPGLATPLVDYNELSGTVTFDPNDDTARATVTAVDDMDREINETVVVALNAGTDYNAAPGTAIVRIWENDLAPIAVDDGTYTIHAGNTLVVTAANGVLGNDINAYGGTLTATLATNTSHGTVTLSSDGGFTYVPTTGYVGPDSFTYKAVNAAGASVPAVVLLAVTNTPPVAVADFYSVPHGNTLTVTAPAGLLANDYDTDNDTLSVSLAGSVDPAGAGTVLVAGDGGFVFTPDPNYIGQVTFNYTASDGIEASGDGTVTISVLGDRPVANNDEFVTGMDKTLNLPAPGVLYNDFSIDPMVTLTAVIETNPSNGVLSLSSDGSLVYIPNTGFFGTDSFTYRASENGLLSADVAQVTITVLKIKLEVADSDPGTGYVPINGNNDNGSDLVDSAKVPKSAGIPTVRDYDSKKTLTNDDPELKKVTMTVSPAPQSPNGFYLLSVTNSGTGRIRLWKDAKKTEELGGGQNPVVFTAANPPTEFYVEGLEMTSAGNGGTVGTDVDLKMVYFSVNLPNQGPAEVADGKVGVAVTPVITGFNVLVGSVEVVNFKDEKGKALFSLGMTTAPAKDATTGKYLTYSGADTLANLFRRNMPGAVGQGASTGPTLVQVTGYGGTAAFVNGDPTGPKNAMDFTVDGKAKSANAHFYEDPSKEDSKELPVTQMLDAGTRRPDPEPTAPDYLGTRSNDAGNGIASVTALDTPGYILPLKAESVPLGQGFQSMALRYNYRLYLMWRYPGTNGGPDILFPLAYLDWDVFFRANRDAASGLLVKDAASKVSAGTFKIDHSNPAILAKPDFNQHFDVRLD